MNILIDITPDEFNQIRGNLPAADTPIKVDDTSDGKTITLNVTGEPNLINALNDLINFINQNFIAFAEGAVLDKLLQLSKFAQSYAKVLPKGVVQQ